MKKGVSESQFSMWRAVLAFAFVDNNLSIEEQQTLNRYVFSVPFSDAQLKILRGDFSSPQNVEELYKKITESGDRKRFCEMARVLAWCEGDITKQEEKILKRLSCLKNDAEETLKSTRDSDFIKHYHSQYEKAESMAAYFASNKPYVEIRV